MLLRKSNLLCSISHECECIINPKIINNISKHKFLSQTSINMAQDLNFASFARQRNWNPKYFAESPFVLKKILTILNADHSMHPHLLLHYSLFSNLLPLLATRTFVIIASDLVLTEKNLGSFSIACILKLHHKRTELWYCITAGGTKHKTSQILVHCSLFFYAHTYKRRKENDVLCEHARMK